MTKLFNIEDRMPIWIALSDFYLDTELQEYTFKSIARTILSSPYTFNDVKLIDKYEVFPVLQPNLLHIAGEWAAFSEDWLVDKIATRLNHKTWLNDIGVALSYKAFAWVHKSYWIKLEQIYIGLKTNTEI